MSTSYVTRLSLPKRLLLAVALVLGVSGVAASATNTHWFLGSTADAGLPGTVIDPGKPLPSPSIPPER